MKRCTQCKSLFEILPEDLRFYGMMQVPEPRRCPSCRMQRRMVWRNERVFYHRSCDLCHRSIVAMYPANTAHPVYCSSCFWSDRWDASKWRLDFDFSRSFFEQFHKLLSQVPREALVVVASENSEFNNHCRFSKNCYLCSLIGNSEDCYTSYWIWDSKDIVNSSYVNNSQLCADSFRLLNCYGCIGCVNCVNSTSCYFSYDLQNCQDCLFCWNLTDQRYQIFNRQYSKDEYEKIVKNLKSGSFANYQKAQQEFEKTVLPHAIRRYAWIVNSENATGDHLIDCKNAHHTFDAVDCEDVRYCTSLLHVKDAMDCYSIGIKPSELIYESCVSRESNHNVKFTNNIFASRNIEYSDSVMQSEDCFGCAGIRNKKFCILNRSYSEKEYYELADRIKELMRRTGEYGEYFPMSLSPFAYNETVAMDYYPLSGEQALALGARWKIEMTELSIPANAISLNAQDLPDSIQDIDNSICEKIILCQKTGRPFRLTRQELALYRQLQLPLPRLHPDVRHAERLCYRNPRTLFKRPCASCGQNIQSVFSKERPEKIYCEACYLKIVR